MKDATFPSRTLIARLFNRITIDANERPIDAVPGRSGVSTPAAGPIAAGPIAVGAIATGILTRFPEARPLKSTPVPAASAVPPKQYSLMLSPPPHPRHGRPAPKTLSIADDLQICIRPITPEDRERMLEGLQSITVETSYRRFFTPSFYPSDDELRYLTDVDYDRHVALGVVDCTREGHPGVGAARYVRLADEPTIAEAAVLVIDAYQHRGIGSLLLAALSQHAAQNGVARFRGFVLQDNDAFLSYLRALGALDETTREGVVQIDLPVYPDLDPVPKTPRTERAHWAWKKLQRADERVC